MNLIKPKALKPGDTLGLVACSIPINGAGDAPIDRCTEFLKSKGFKIIEAPNCRRLTGHAAGSVQERVQAFHDFFSDKKVDGILSFWGGHNSHQLLEYLDFELIKKNPKPLIGYSDTTSLLAGIHAKTGLVTYLGPAGITFGKPSVPDFTWSHFEKTLITPSKRLEWGISVEYSENPWWTESPPLLKFKPNPGWSVYRKGKTQGKIIAGNAGTLLLLAGTPYWPKLKGAILCLEDDEAESTRTIDRYFTQLRQMGVFEQIAGLIVGRFHEAVKFKEEDSLKMILDDSLKGTYFPVITEVDFGHTDPLLTLPLGIQCELNADKPSIALLEEATS